VKFEDGYEIKVSYDNYPKIFGVGEVKTYMDDFLGALAGAVKNGTKIIGVGPSN
jgi:hypothetical protein